MDVPCDRGEVRTVLGAAGTTAASAAAAACRDAADTDRDAPAHRGAGCEPAATAADAAPQVRRERPVNLDTAGVPDQPDAAASPGARPRCPSGPARRPGGPPPRLAASAVAAQSSFAASARPVAVSALAAAASVTSGAVLRCAGGSSAAPDVPVSMVAWTVSASAPPPEAPRPPGHWRAQEPPVLRGRAEARSVRALPPLEPVALSRRMQPPARAR
jgi:translation initiation factor IF-2